MHKASRCAHMQYTYIHMWAPTTPSVSVSQSLSIILWCVVWCIAIMNCCQLSLFPHLLHFLSFLNTIVSEFYTVLQQVVVACVLCLSLCTLVLQCIASVISAGYPREKFEFLRHFSVFNIVSCKYCIFSVCYTIRMYIKVCIHVWVCTYVY